MNSIPHEIIDSAMVRELEARTIASGVESYSLMQSAGEAVAEIALQRLADSTASARVVVVAGPGNNGGDGFVAAEVLRGRGVATEVLHLVASSASADAIRARVDYHGDCRCIDEQRTLDEQSRSALANADLIVDALFGIGLSRPLQGNVADWVRAINRSDSQVLAVDVPSGLDADRAERPDVVVEADATVTFHRAKAAHVLAPARGVVGTLYCADIALASALNESMQAQHALGAVNLNAPMFWQGRLRPPGPEDHKYRRGHVGVLCSDDPLATGASRLSADAALSAGAGLVSLAGNEAALLICASHCSEIMLQRVEHVEDITQWVERKRVNTLVIGPGLGVSQHTRERVCALLRLPINVVLDADAISSFAGNGERLIEACAAARARVVLTPHAGEFERTFAALLPQLRPSDRLHDARAAATVLKQVLVLKGSDTLIAHPDGRLRINAAAPAALATAGSGDVLAGLVAALLAQGLTPFNAASAAVWLHAEAARALSWPLRSGHLAGAVPALIRTL